METPYEQRSFTIGNVVGEAFGLYFRFFVRFFVLGLVVYLVVDLLSALVSTTDSDAARIVWGALAVVASIVGFFWLQGAFVVQVEDVRDGRIDTSLTQVFERTRPRLPQLIASGFLVGIAIGAIAIVLALLGL